MKRRHVLFADGTWRSDRDRTDTTNVQKLCDAVLPADASGVVQRKAPSVWERHERCLERPSGPYRSENLLGCREYARWREEWLSSQVATR